MLYSILSFLLPPLLVFGVYHLFTWFNVFRMNERTTWKRVGIASAVCHLLLASGFLIFSYVEFQANQRLDPSQTQFGAFLFNRSSFWRMMSIFDTAPMLVILALFSILDRAGVNPPGILILTIVITYVIGTLQWFFIGGAVGALLEKFWEGLKTGDEEDEEWL
jgi:hypothetical protein